MLRPIEGFKDYLISDKGRVLSLKTETWLTPSISEKGYMFVKLKNEKGEFNKRIHRLVAEAFTPNPDKLPTVNHIDEDKTNNRVENLEWMTVEDNVRYGTAAERRAESRRRTEEYRRKLIAENPSAFAPAKRYRRPVLCVELGVVYPSITEAARQHEVSVGQLGNCLAGRLNSTRGYHWVYYDN